MKSSSSTVIPHPVERIDLVQWLSTMSDRDYQACSRAHRAAGTFREGGTLGMVNVESVGGNLLVQHYYLAAGSTPNHVVMHSKTTRVYVTHLVPFTIEVIWTLEVEPNTKQSATFRCTVDTRLPLLLDIMSRLTLLPFFLRRHTREETVGFAEDIARKVAGGTQSRSVA